MRKIILIFLILSCLQCKKEYIKINNQSVSLKNDSIITIIFEKKDYSKDTLYYIGGSYSPTTEPITFFRENDFEAHQLRPNNFSETDTIVLKSKKSIILEHKYHFYFNSIYKFKPGDTVLFKYKNSAPYASVLNRKINNNDLNFQTEFNLNNKKPVSREEFYLNNKRFRDDNEQESYIGERINIELKYMNALDSLMQNNIIHKESYLVLKNSLRFSNPILHIKKGYDNELKQDSLLAISSFRLFLNNYSQYKFKINTIKKSQNMIVLNYKDLFDSIIKNSYLYSNNNKDFIMLETLQNIANEFSIDDFEVYFKKFSSETNNSKLIEYVKNKFIIDLSSLKKDTKNVHLINLKDEKKLFKDILKQNKGKIIYVDFWASWCAPCLAEMPASRAIREKYKNKDVIFIFISIDKDYNSWEKSSIDLNIQFNNFNFLAINYPKAELYKTLQISEIPRYLIYDKKGELRHLNAFAPSSNEIENLLDGYLLE